MMVLPDQVNGPQETTPVMVPPLNVTAATLTVAAALKLTVPFGTTRVPKPEIMDPAPM
jgi:hypothetical protein